MVAAGAAACGATLSRTGVTPPVTPPASDSTAVDPSKAQPNRRTTLYRAPDGPPAGAITSETPLRVLSRSGEWARVQFEGWVKTSDLQTNTPGVLVGVSAAELRTDPARFQGQVLKWRLQFIAVEIADDLRPDVPDGATYLLARGPSPEHGFVYVVVPDAKKALVASLAPNEIAFLVVHAGTGVTVAEQGILNVQYELRFTGVPEADIARATTYRFSSRPDARRDRRSGAETLSSESCDHR